MFKLAKLARPCGRGAPGDAGSCKNQPGDLAVAGPLFSCAAAGALIKKRAARARRIRISIFPVIVCFLFYAMRSIGPNPAKAQFSPKAAKPEKRRSARFASDSPGTTLARAEERKRRAENIYLVRFHRTNVVLSLRAKKISRLKKPVKTPADHSRN